MEEEYGQALGAGIKEVMTRLLAAARSSSSGKGEALEAHNADGLTGA